MNILEGSTIEINKKIYTVDSTDNKKLFIEVESNDFDIKKGEYIIFFKIRDGIKTKARIESTGCGVSYLKEGDKLYKRVYFNGSRAEKI